DLHTTAIRFERFVQDLIADIERGWGEAGYPVEVESITFGHDSFGGLYVWADFKPDSAYLKANKFGQTTVDEGYRLAEKTRVKLGFSSFEIQVSSDTSPEYRVTGVRYWGTGA
ncbi:hypothetical protein ACU06L_00035, partial [Paraburkholderia sp. MAHUQ-67]